jgi:hypothetical protein
MTELQTADADALTDLLQSRGWALFREGVLAEVTADFEEHITRALDVSDGVAALDRMRQVAAVRKAGLRWLAWPKAQRDLLRAGPAPVDAGSPYGRRGSL